jgi:hypothetical protein
MSKKCAAVCEAEIDYRMFYNLDSHADVPIFNNPDLLSNIRTLKKGYRVSVAGGEHVFNQVGTHCFLGTVIYDPENKYNIVPECAFLSRGYFIKYAPPNKFLYIVDIEGKVVMTFFNDKTDNLLKCSVEDASLMNCGADKRSAERSKVAVVKRGAFPLTLDQAEENVRRFFTLDQRRRAALVRSDHQIDHASEKQMIERVNSPSVTNFPYTAADVINCRIIYGKCPSCSFG